MTPSRLPLARLLLPWCLLVVACAPDDDDLEMELAFRITQECTDDGSCEPVCEDTWCDFCDEGQPPGDGGCWITGIGFLVDTGGKDNFGGNGMPMKAGYMRGQWEHVDHATGNKLHASVSYLVCRHVDEPGPGVPNGPNHDFDINQAYYGGQGRWFEPDVGWQDGYWFDVRAEDHGEPGKSDEYYFSVRRMSDGAVVYETGGVLGGGNFQIHPPNAGHPFTLGQLPAWVTLQQ